jgi:hypothetical protein
MPLTVEEMRMADTARLEKLVADIMVAKRSAVQTKIDDALDALNDFITDTPFIDLQKSANDTLKAADVAQIEVALGELAAIAAKLDPAGEAFKSAAKIAASGKAELLFPRLAATASQSLEIFTELQNAATKLSAIPANVNSLKDLPDAIIAVKTALVALQAKVRTASGT